MAGLRLILLLGASLAYNALIVEGGFLKAALGLRIGLSPEEKGWGQPYQHHGGPAVKGQFLTGVQKPGGHGGGWGHGGGGNGGFLKHLKILGVNLYLGGPKHHHAGGGGHHFAGHHGGTHYSKGGWGWGKSVPGYSSHPQYSPAKPGNGGIDYSTNEVTVIGGDGKGQTSHYGYATSLVGKVFGNPSPNHPFGPNPQGKPTQQHIVYVPAASQYPTHYANEVVNEIKFLNGKGNSPAMTMGNEGPRPPTINGPGGVSFSPAQGGHYNGPALRGSGGPPPQGFSLASLMKGPQWAPKQQSRGMARFLPFFGLRGSGGPPPPPGHPMHSPYRRPGPPPQSQRSPGPQQQQQSNSNGPDGPQIPSYSTLYNVKTPNSHQLVAQGTGYHQQQQSSGFNGNNQNGDYRPHAFGGFVESSNSVGPAGPGGIPFVPRHVQHSSHPSSPTYLLQQNSPHSNHPRSHFNAQNSQRNPFSQQGGPPQRGQQGPPPSFSSGGPPPNFGSGGPGGPPPSFSSGGPPPNFGSGGPGGPPPSFSSGGPPPNFGSDGPQGGPETVVHSFPPQHSHPQGPNAQNGLGYHSHNSLETFNPPAFSPIPSSGEQGGPSHHGGPPPSSSSGSSLIQFGNPGDHLGYHENSPPAGSGFISLAASSAGPIGSSQNYPYISPLGPFASEKQRQFASQHKTQYASGSGPSQNAVEFNPSSSGGPQVEFSPNGPVVGGHAQVYNEQSMGGYEPLPGFAYSHTISSPVVSMGMTTKDDPPVMMEENSIPPEFKNKDERGSSSGESSSHTPVKRRFATSQEQQQEIYLNKRLQGAGSSSSSSTTQIQSPVAASTPARKVRGGYLNTNMASLANNDQAWSPIGQSSSKIQVNQKKSSSSKQKGQNIQSRSSLTSGENGGGDMASSATEMNAKTLTKVGPNSNSSSSSSSSSSEILSKPNYNSKIQYTRVRSTTSTTSTEQPSTSSTSSSSTVAAST